MGVSTLTPSIMRSAICSALVFVVSLYAGPTDRAGPARVPGAETAPRLVAVQEPMQPAAQQCAVTSLGRCDPQSSRAARVVAVSMPLAANVFDSFLAGRCGPICNGADGGPGQDGQAGGWLIGNGGKGGEATTDGQSGGAGGAAGL